VMTVLEKLVIIQSLNEDFAVEHLLHLFSCLPGATDF